MDSTARYRVGGVTECLTVFNFMAPGYTVDILLGYYIKSPM